MGSLGNFKRAFGFCLPIFICFTLIPCASIEFINATLGRIATNANNFMNLVDGGRKACSFLAASGRLDEAK